MMNRILTRVFADRFNRARLFLLSPNKEYLMGFAAVGNPPPTVPIKALQVPVTVPDANTPTHLPEKPTVMSEADFPNGVPLYCQAFDKVNAPYWADFPLYGPKGQSTPRYSLQAAARRRQTAPGSQAHPGW